MHPSSQLRRHLSFLPDPPGPPRLALPAPFECPFHTLCGTVKVKREEHRKKENDAQKDNSSSVLCAVSGNKK